MPLLLIFVTGRNKVFYRRCAPFFTLFHFHTRKFTLPEEKTHVGEFQELLLREDREQVAELKHGKEEVKEITGK